jgi:chromosomal replication initiator protein
VWISLWITHLSRLGAVVEARHAAEIWAGVLDEVRNRVSSQKFQTWFEPIQVLSFEGDALVLEVPNPFFGDWFEEHNVPILLEIVEKVAGVRAKVRFVISSAYYDGAASSPVEPEPLRPMTPPTRPPVPVANHNLYPRFTFEHFVVGKSNEFAHAASIAVGKEPGGVYNPLFIYGGTGLGKTHLMQAIGHAALETNPTARIFYASSENFMNEMIQSITAGRTLEFRRKYRGLDVLLLDDIQFLSGRDATQEEFFHTFNTLHDARKQIVVTSDRPPKDIAQIEERLISRFNSGLVTDIQPPGLETRVAILRVKAAREAIDMPQDVLFLIAERIQRNIRELEGCLVRLSALSRLLCAPITIDLALEVLRVYAGATEVTVDLGAIQRRVAKEFDVTVESLRGKRRTSSIAFARQVGMYLTKQLTPLTLVEIGRGFGNRDHSTVLYAIDKITDGRHADPSLERRIEGILRELRGEPA